MSQTMQKRPRGKQFDVAIEQLVTAADLDWPRGAAAQEDDLGGNRSYRKLPKFSWGRVRKIIEQERGIVDRISAAPSYMVAYQSWLDDRELGVGEYLIGLELGTNALVAALRAGRCLPFYSCNGGAFGGDHDGEHPVVTFLCRPQLLPFIADAAREAEVGLASSHMVAITAYAQNVDAFIDMAEELHQQSPAMAAVALPSLARPAPRRESAATEKDDPRQPCLL